MKSKRLFCILVLISLVIVSTSSCDGMLRRESEVKTETYYQYFDTVCMIQSYAGDSESKFEENTNACEEILSDYNKLLDIYHTYSGVSNIKTVNDSAGKAAVKVDRRLIEFLTYAKDIYSLTNGTVNIAMGSVLSLWHDCREAALNDPENARIPTSAELQEAQGHTDISKLEIDEENSTVFLSDEKMSLDVGALGKGYVTKLIADMLTEKGVTSYILNIGGNIHTLGSKANGEAWKIGIKDPFSDRANDIVGTVAVMDTSVVTSGDYERYYTVDGKKYHHIIDPSTAMPSDNFSSVTVLSSDSALADALSTALFCMSKDDGIALISEMQDCEAIFVMKNGSISYTAGSGFVRQE